MDIDALVNQKKHRLKFFTLIKKSFSGLERALTIIARYHMFNEKNIDNNTFSEEEIKNILKKWLGFTANFKVENKSYEIIEDEHGWLNNYLRRVFLENILQNCLNDLEKYGDSNNLKEVRFILQEMSYNAKIDDLIEKKNKLDKIELNVKDNEIKTLVTNIGRLKYVIDALYKLQFKSISFEKNMFTDKYEKTVDSKEGNTYKQITYDRILANAFYLGPLKSYYLACNAQLFENVKRYTANSSNAKNLSGSDKDLILKVIAAYLLQRKNINSVQEYVYINQMDIANWLVKKADPDKFELEKYKLLPSNEEIFNSVNIGGNVKKIKIHKNFINGFTIVEDIDISRIKNKDLIFFKDLGSNFSLEEEIINF